MSIARKATLKRSLLAMFLFSSLAIAGSVIISGTQYSCEHECVVSMSPHGWMLSDSGGGWIKNEGPAKKVQPPKA
jgi:hypothetical protein